MEASVEAKFREGLLHEFLEEILYVLLKIAIHEGF